MCGSIPEIRRHLAPLCLCLPLPQSIQHMYSIHYIHTDASVHKKLSTQGINRCWSNAHLISRKHSEKPIKVYQPFQVFFLDPYNISSPSHFVSAPLEGVPSPSPFHKAYHPSPRNSAAQVLPLLLNFLSRRKPPVCSVWCSVI